MKAKSKLYLALFFISFLLSPIINIVSADEGEDYVGIDEDKEYIWKAQVDEEVCEDYNPDLEGIKIIIEDIGENTHVDDANPNLDYDYVIVEIKYYVSEDFEDKDWEENKDLTSVNLIDNQAIKYAQMIHEGVFFYFVSKDIIESVWDTIAKTMEFDYDMEVSSLSDGLQFEQGDAEITMRYNGEGVLSEYVVEISGDQCYALVLQGFIPGFPLPILFGTTMVSIVGVIIIYLRKKKY